MLENLRKQLMMGLGAHMLLGAVFADADEPLGLIELDESLEDVEKPPELPPGNYTGEIQDVQVQTSGKGNRYYQISFVIPEDEIPADVKDGFPDGAKFFYNRLLVPDGKNRRALYNLRQFMTALGLDTNTNQIDPNTWMGQSARLKVVMGKYQGEDRAEIRAVEAAESKAAPRGASRGAERPASAGRAAAGKARAGRGR